MRYSDGTPCSSRATASATAWYAGATAAAVRERRFPPISRNLRALGSALLVVSGKLSDPLPPPFEELARKYFEWFAPEAD